MNRLQAYRLAAPSDVRKLLTERGIQIKKRLGQNFLIDRNVVDKIVAAAEILPEDVVLEIGPGVGGLTQALAQSGAHVVALEIDRELVALLEELFSATPNVTIVASDALTADLHSHVPPGGSLKVVANLPYYITSPLIMRLLEEGLPVRLAVLMVQSEVADRLVAAPGTKAYGALTVAVQYRAEVERVIKAPRTVFLPQPNVDSTVVKLRPRPYPRPAADEALLFAVVKASFAQRRKTLRNALQALAAEYGIDSTALLERAGIPPGTRGESLAVDDFITIAETIRLVL